MAVEDAELAGLEAGGLEAEEGFDGLLVEGLDVDGGLLGGEEDLDAEPTESAEDGAFAGFSSGELAGGDEEAAADEAGGAEDDEPPAEEPVIEEEAPDEEAPDEEPVDMEALEKEALSANVSVAELEADEEDDVAEDDESAEIADHLKDAVEGSLRLKRMLSRDQEQSAGGAVKKRKTDDGDGPRPIIQAKVKQVLAKFGSMGDAVMKHVLDQCTVDELQYLLSANFYPNKFDTRKTAAELCAQHLVQQKERKLGGGARTDIISAFRLRWSLGLEAEKLLRSLSHKDLRYVLTTFDGNSTLQESIDEAAGHIVEDDENTQNACPDGPGIKVMGRFNRLELIDPLADCAVFGDANLTFSMNLAKHRADFGHVGRVIATTFEEVETLRERYQEIDQSIKMLEEHHAEVYHGVDCTRIALDPRFEGMEGKLGAVYYNYPHSGAIQGFFDSNPMVNWRHENLMRLFFRALRSFVKPGGVVKVASNSGATGVRYSFIVGSAIENEFTHTETMPFTEWHLHRYGRSYGDRRDTYRRPDAKNNQSYNAQNAASDMVYCFTYAPSGTTLGKQQIRLPPNLKTLAQCRDGPFKNLAPGSAQRALLAKKLHERFLKEVSGTHVG